jgi:hypothetical protein
MMRNYKVHTVVRQIWFLGLVAMALLAVWGVLLNVGLPVGQEKTDQILVHVRNQEGCKVIIWKFTSIPQSRDCWNEKGTSGSKAEFEKLRGNKQGG